MLFCFFNFEFQFQFHFFSRTSYWIVRIVTTSEMEAEIEEKKNADDVDDSPKKKSKRAVIVSSDSSDGELDGMVYNSQLKKKKLFK